MKSTDTFIKIAAVIMLAFAVYFVLNNDAANQDPTGHNNIPQLGMFEPGAYIYDVIDNRYAMRVQYIGGVHVMIDSVYAVNDSSYIVRKSTGDSLTVLFKELLGIFFINNQKEK